MVLMGFFPFLIEEDVGLSACSSFKEERKCFLISISDFIHGVNASWFWVFCFEQALNLEGFS